MSELEKQVQRAQRRINLQRFLATCIWALAVCLGVAVVALAVPKVTHIDVDPAQWRWGWIVGAVVMGLLAAATHAWLGRRNMVEAAIEIDRRYGLKERVASSLSLTPDEANTDVGKALVADAARRVERIDVREQFDVQVGRWALLPFVTGALAIAMVLIPDAKPDANNAKASAKTVEVKSVKKSTQALKKRLAKKSQELKDKQLPDAGKLAKKLEHSMDKLAKAGTDKKKALVEMSDLKKMLQEQRLGKSSSDELRKKLNQLKGMKLKQGPAEKLAKAMQQGDFKQALQQVQDLQRRLADGKLTPEQQKKMSEQLQQMQQRMQKMTQQHEQAKQDLQKKIEQAQKQGNKAAAERLQKKLEQMQQQDEAMEKMAQMAKKMQQMAKAMKEGDQQAAKQQLSELAQELKEMQMDLDEMQAMDDLMDQLADAKNAMNCDACNGTGCSMCQGFGDFGMEGDMPGMGLGEGQGQGDRPEEKTKHKFYDSKVKANPRAGSLVITGNAPGPNKPGEALEAIKTAMDAAAEAEENPLTNVRLPRSQREQAQQYFDAVRGATE